jgi:hypothetical protein
MGRHFPLVIAAYNEAMVEALRGPLGTFVRPGDEVDLVSGNRDHALSVPTLNRWATDLSSVLPSGVRFAAHTSSLDKAATIAEQATPVLASILLEYEPQWDPLFTWEAGPSLTHFDQFATLCRARGRRAIAYPTGRPLLEPPLQRWAWDYGEIRKRVDDVYPQTQHWATVGSAGWSGAIQKLRSQWGSHGFDPATLTIQLTLGTRDNGLTAVAAAARLREARSQGVNRVYLWWAPEVLGDVTDFLGVLELAPG